jgi:hypothetical protein
MNLLLNIFSSLSSSLTGLQMSDCWSGSFLQGTGVWFGSGVREVSLVNHQVFFFDLFLNKKRSQFSITFV